LFVPFFCLAESNQDGLPRFKVFNHIIFLYCFHFEKRKTNNVSKWQRELARRDSVEIPFDEKAMKLRKVSK